MLPSRRMLAHNNSLVRRFRIPRTGINQWNESFSPELFVAFIKSKCQVYNNGVDSSGFRRQHAASILSELRANGYHEFGAENRPTGNKVVLRVEKVFGKEKKGA